MIALRSLPLGHAAIYAWMRQALSTTVGQLTAGPYVIDLHFHILPGIDDGPPDLDQSLALARAAQADGVQIVAATPHLRDDHPGVRAEELPARCASLNAAIAEADIALQVVAAGELDVLWVQQASVEELQLASYDQAGTDVLLETPYGPLAPSFDAALERLWSLGYRVLLAHPERNRTFQQAPERLAALVRVGLLVQVTAGSLASREKRSASRALGMQLITHRLAHVIASDAHRATEFRPPNLSVGFAAAAAVDAARAQSLVIDAPLAILAGAPLPADSALPQERPS
jgi:protein-tyrosine phosphatase